MSGCWWLEHDFDVHIYWEFHHPNWLSYCSEELKPPTRWIMYNEWWWMTVIKMMYEWCIMDNVSHYSGMINDYWCIVHVYWWCMINGCLVYKQCRLVMYNGLWMTSGMTQWMIHGWLVHGYPLVICSTSSIGKPWIRDSIANFTIW